MTKSLDMSALIDLKAEIIESMRGRAAMYGLLARLYEKEVTQELLDSLCQMKMPKSTGNDHVDCGYKLLAGYLSNRWERTEEELRIDYFRIFFGNGMNGDDAAYPFESVHTSPTRIMMQDSRDEVLTLYRAEGLEKSETWKDGEDHIALELGFQRILCDKCVDLAREENWEVLMNKIHTQQNFLVDHLNNWVPMLMEDVLHYAKTDFYRALAELTAGFLENEELFLEDLLNEVEEPEDE